MLHYIFLDIGLKPLKERDDYLENIKHNSKLYPEYKIWNDKDVEELIDTHYSDIKERIYKMPKPYLCDLARALIMNIHGGLYSDMDVKINQIIPDRDFIHSLYTYPDTQKQVLGNSLLKLPADLYYPFIIYCLDEFDRVSQIKVYETWKYRKLLQTVGGRALARFCKKNKLAIDFPFYDYCSEKNTYSILHASSNKPYKIYGC